MLGRRAVFLWWPVLLVAVPVLVAVLVHDRLPEPMATHFGPSGAPDGTLPRLLGTAVAPLLAAASVLVLVAVTRAGRRVSDARVLAGVCYAVLGLAVGLQMALVASNAGADEAGDARLAGTGWLALTLVLGGAGTWGAHRCLRTDPLTAGSWADVDVERRGDDLVVVLRGLDVLWCLRRTVRLPAASVLRAQVVPLSSVRPSGLRLPGTSVPGVLQAGSFGRAPSRDFWDVRTGPDVLVLTVADGQAYQRLVLQPRDPHDVLAALQVR